MVLDYRTTRLDAHGNETQVSPDQKVFLKKNLFQARLRGDGKNGKTASKTLVAALWDDIQCRAKVLSPGDASVSRKQIQVLSNEFRVSWVLLEFSKLYCGFLG